MSKKILFLIDELYPNTSANSRIVYRIIDELVKKSDMEISIIGKPITKEQLSIKEYKGCRVIHKPYLDSETVQLTKTGIYKYKITRIIKYIFTPKNYWYKYQKLVNNFMPYYAECVKYIEGMVKRKEIDCIVACSMPFEPLYVAARFGKRVPVFYYMMEPYSTLKHAKWSNVHKMYNQETFIDDMAMKIFAPPLVVKEYSKIKPLNRNIYKFIPTEFPNIIQRNIKNFDEELNNKKCNVFYIGKLYSKVRNPKYLFDLVEKLKDKNIVLHCVGGINEDFSDDFKNKYLSGKISNIIYHGEVSPEKADWYASKADILVNIGNVESNLLPSKLIDYISMGKPIVNISQISDCATLPYMKKYPLGVQLYEADELTEDVVNLFYDFCMTCKGRYISFEDIKKMYGECTPEYVTQLISNEIYKSF